MGKELRGCGTKPKTEGKK